MIEKQQKYFESAKAIQSPKQINPYPQCFAYVIFSEHIKMNSLIRKAEMPRDL